MQDISSRKSTYKKLSRFDTVYLECIGTKIPIREVPCPNLP